MEESTPMFPMRRERKMQWRAMMVTPVRQEQPAFPPTHEVFVQLTPEQRIQQLEAQLAYQGKVLEQALARIADLEAVVEPMLEDRRIGDGTVLQTLLQRMDEFTEAMNRLVDVQTNTVSYESEDAGEGVRRIPARFRRGR